MTDLHQRSIEIILQNQSPTGAYPACPNFPTYQYSWFRDGAFIAYAMDLSGHYESAGRFHDWAARNILKRGDVVARALLKARANEPLGAEDILHTRYLLSGEEADEPWPNFQLDGFGVWLWALRQHQLLSRRDLPLIHVQAARLAADYIAALWRRPCYDCWEEFPEHIHAYTLASIYGGLQAHAELSGHDHSAALAEIRAFLLANAVHRGHFVKFIGSTEVDASLLGLATPFEVFPPDHPLVAATVQEIEAHLLRDGGVHRYAWDTYYGGGAWVLLTAWLGWHYARVGEREKAWEALRWVETQADEAGELPEQTPVNLNDASYYEPWRQRWGEIAKPLLWSHAMYIVLHSELL
ncbi:MAG: glycoside hydrolase family 15 protein [Chloroflexi bacterium]|nr:glycoside hydrolase family 15 protein [Chloroflexota bacterium]